MPDLLSHQLRTSRPRVLVRSPLINGSPWTRWTLCNRWTLICNRRRILWMWYLYLLRVPCWSAIYDACWEFIVLTIFESTEGFRMIGSLCSLVWEIDWLKIWLIDWKSWLMNQKLLMISRLKYDILLTSAFFATLATLNQIPHRPILAATGRESFEKPLRYFGIDWKLECLKISMAFFCSSDIFTRKCQCTPPLFRNPGYATTLQPPRNCEVILGVKDPGFIHKFFLLNRRSTSANS